MSADVAVKHLWPVILPERLKGAMAAAIERQGAAAGRYPPEWPAAAWAIKTMAGWACERCGHPHEDQPPWVLTVHHLDGDKWNLQSWNLAALCQRCHLRVQNRVIFYQDWPFPHSPWMARHVAEYNEWARAHRRPELTLVGEVERDYSTEWPAVPASRRRAHAPGNPMQADNGL